MIKLKMVNSKSVDGWWLMVAQNDGPTPGASESWMKMSVKMVDSASVY